MHILCKAALLKHKIIVFNKNVCFSGWWFVQTEYGFGWAPATYLTPLHGDEEEETETVFSSTRCLFNLKEILWDFNIKAYTNF